MHPAGPAPAGTAPLALLLHSGGLSGAQWKRLASALVAQGRSVWAPDLLGYGESTAWPETERFDFHADVDGAAAMLRAAPSPVHVVGRSYGGFVGALRRWSCRRTCARWRSSSR